MQPTNLTYDAFISYKRKGGTPWAELLYLVLKRIKKKKIYIDRHSIKGGEEWEQSLITAIRASANIIVVVFPELQDIDFGTDDIFIQEITEALRIKREDNKYIKIIPFYVEGLSSYEIHSSDSYKNLPVELKQITSTTIQDISFNPDYDEWIDRMSDSLISIESILQHTHYLVQINPLCDMEVYDDATPETRHRLTAHGKTVSYWVKKEDAMLILRCVKDKRDSYTITIDTTASGKEHISWFDENQTYFYVQGDIDNAGFIRLDREKDKIIIGIQWGLKNLSVKEKAMNIKYGIFSRTPDIVPHLDCVINPVMYNK